jgi:hypothetical protein
MGTDHGPNKPCISTPQNHPPPGAAPHLCALIVQAALLLLLGYEGLHALERLGVAVLGLAGRNRQVTACGWNTLHRG